MYDASQVVGKWEMGSHFEKRIRPTPLMPMPMPMAMSMPMPTPAPILTAFSSRDDESQFVNPLHRAASAMSNIKPHTKLASCNL